MRLATKVAVIVGLLALAMVPRSYAQVTSNTANVNLNATMNETLTVSATPGTVNFALVPNGPVSGNSPVSITTQWALAATRTSVALWAYFTNTTALTNGTYNIPNTSVSGNPNGGGLTPFSTANPFNGASTGVQIFNYAITSPAGLNVTRTDSLALQIDTTGLGLPAGTYTGVLNIQAVAN